MAPKCLTESLQRLTRGMAAELLGEVSDQDLIELFLHERSETAFEAMVRRHGPMAYRVCWGVLRQTQDTEDAVQATFLLLAQRLGSIRKRQSLASWIHGVAYRTALTARSQDILRRRHENLAASSKSYSCGGDDPEQIFAMLDAELVRLPERWRLPVLLHYFQGRSQEEAARELCWSKNTFRRRLDKARGSLAMRLRRQGVDWPPASALSAWSGLVVSGLVPKELLAPIVDLAIPLSQGASITGVSVQVITLVQGVGKIMRLAKLKIVASGLLGIVLFTGGASLFVRHVFADGPAAMVNRTEPRSHSERLAKVAARVETPVERDDQAPSVKNSQPVVVRTLPQAGDTKVDAAAVTEIKVTFSKEMKDGSWSWSQISKETFPQLAGKPHFDKDQKTCILPVKLEAGKTYVLWLNPPRFQGFVDTDGNAAAFYPLVFETKP